MSHESREIFVGASHDSRETFARMSDDSRANFNQFYDSQLSLKMVLFMSHICRIVQIAEISLRCVCERLRRVGDGFAKYAMTCGRFCDQFAMHARTLRFHSNVRRRFRESIRKTVANSSHPSEIGALD